jgi:hypothetical protein
MVKYVISDEREEYQYKSLRESGSAAESPGGAC